jgi:hypothetical protein
MDCFFCWSTLKRKVVFFDSHEDNEKARFYSGSYPPNCWRGIFTLVPIPRETTPREALNCLKEPL